MKLAEQQGNLLRAGGGILVHGCNCLGVMGAGVAKAIQDAWPVVFKAYRAHQSKVGLRLGDVVFVASESLRGTAVAPYIHVFTTHLPSGVIVANAMTQQDVGSDPDKVYVSYDAISAVFARIALVARAGNLPVHFPLIGCGLANGKWEEVVPRIENALGDIPGTLWRL